MDNLLQAPSWTIWSCMTRSSFHNLPSKFWSSLCACIKRPQRHRTAWPGPQFSRVVGTEKPSLLIWMTSQVWETCLCSAQTRASLQGLQWMRSSWLSQTTVQTGIERVCRQRGLAWSLTPAQWQWELSWCPQSISWHLFAFCIRLSH